MLVGRFFEGARIDYKLIELKDQLEAAKKASRLLPGSESAMKSYQAFLESG